VRTRNLLLLGVMIVVIVTCGALFVLPPYHNKYSCVAQLWFGKLTGVWLHHRPERFIGRLRIWDERGTLVFEHDYLDGKRHGQWREYNSNVVTSSCTYSNDQPWEGLCHFWEDKSWLGEYRAGKPWKGRLPHITGQGETEWKSFMDGVEVSDEEYKRRLHIEATSTVIGIHHTR
jgi:hypothetical protein